MGNKNLRHTVILIVASLLLITGCGEEEQGAAEANHLQRASAYEDQGQFKAATIEYKNAVKKSKGESPSLVAYANMLITLGQFGSAIELLDQVVSGQDKAFYLARVEAYQGMHKYTSAKDVLDSDLKAHASDKDILLLSAYNLLGQGELENALAAYRKILASDVNNSDAKLGEASALIRLEKTKDSVSVLKSIAPTENAYTKAQILLSGIYVGQSKLEQAEEVLTNLLSQLSNTDLMVPEKAVVLERLSYVLTRQGRSNEAYIYTKLLSEAFPGSNEVKEKYQEALRKVQSGDLVAAKSILNDILSKFSNYRIATQLLGVISYLEGDHESASKYLSDSVDPEIATELTRRIYAATNLKLNEPQKVLEILEPTIDRSDSPETLALYGIAAISAKQFAKGESALSRALKLDPDNVRVMLALADYHRTNPKPNKAKEWEYLSSAYKNGSTDTQVLMEVVRYHLRDNEPKKAMSFISAAVEKSPKSVSTNIVAGYLEHQLGTMEKALEYFNAAVENGRKDPAYIGALDAKGKTLNALKKIEQAKAVFEEMIKLFPESESGYKGLLSSFALQGDLQKGKEKLQQYGTRNAQVSPYFVLIQAAISEQDVESANRYLSKVEEMGGEAESIKNVGNAIRYVEALKASNARDFDMAREKIAEILVDEPDNVRLLTLMADLEIKQGRLNEAGKIIGQLGGVSGAERVIDILQGDLAMASQDATKAKTHYQDAWNKYPSEMSGEKLFQVLGILQKTSERSQHLDKWLSRSPNSVRALMHRAIGLQQRGQRLKAAENYEKVLKSQPNNVMALNNLGWIYFEKEKMGQSLELLEKAYKLAPQAAAVVDSYGWVLFKSGKKQQGAELLEKANKLAPDNKEIAEHLKEAKGS